MNTFTSSSDRIVLKINALSIGVVIQLNVNDHELDLLIE